MANLPQSTIEVYATDANLNIVAQVDDLTSLTAHKILNDVGSWELTISEASKNAKYFEPAVNPGGGVLIRRNGSTFLAGPCSGDYEEWNDADSKNAVLTFTGVDHNMWLFSRLIYPNPLQTAHTMDAIFYQLSPKRPVEDIMRNLFYYNIGQGALSNRRQPHFLLAPESLGRGTVRVSDKYRFDNLGEALQKLCNDAVIDNDPNPEFTRLSFDCVQDGLQNVVFTIGNTDKSSLVKFSKNLGTIRGYTISRNRGTATDIIIGAGITELYDDTLVPPQPIPGSSRYAKGLFEYEYTDTLYPGRLEVFVDGGLLNPAENDDTNPEKFLEDQLALDKTAKDEFASSGGQYGATIQPRETTQLQFGRDYQVGDFCTVSVPRLTFVEQIREVELSLDAQKGEQLTVSVGTVEGDYQRRDPGFYRRLTTLRQYMNRIKVAK